MAEQTIGRYTVLRQLAAGRRGLVDVFEALDPQLERRVAIKVIHPPAGAEAEYQQRFHAEVKRVAALRDPHIIQVHDFGLEAGQPYLVMEYLEGGTLADRIAAGQSTGQPLSPEQALSIVRALAAGLDAAHAQGVLHGALCPANVLFGPGAEPVLTDFGLARILGQATLTTPDQPGGSPAYMAPEQAAGRPVDARSDLYSLGIILFQMLTGVLPFTAEAVPALLLQQLADAPPPLSQYAPALAQAVEAVVLKAISKDPAARYDSGRALAAALERAVAAQSETKPAETGAKAPQGGPARLPGDGRSTLTAPPGPGPAEPVAPPFWLRHLAGTADMFGSLIGRQAPTLREAPRDRRGLTATLLGLLGIMLAALQFIASAFDLVSKSIASIGRLMSYLPYVIISLLCGAAALSLYMMARERSPWPRRRAMSVLSLTVVAGLAWGGWSLFERMRPVNGIVVLVGEFEARTGKSVDFPSRIYEALKDEVAGSGDVVVQRTFRSYADSAAARAAGAAEKAALVIWGWYDDAGVNPRIELLRLPSLDREQVGIPLLIKTASAAVQGGAAPAPNEASLRNITRYVRKPLSMPEVDVFVRNGPQQMVYVSTVLLGMVYFVNGDSDHSLAFFDKAVANAQAGGADIMGQEMAYFQRSTVLYQRNRTVEAAADLEKAIEIKPDMFEAHHNLAIVYSQVCDPAWQLDKALQQARTAAQLRPDDAAAHRLLGDLYRQGGQYELALAALQTAARLEPGEPLTQQLLASTYNALGDSKQAQVASEAGLALARKAPPAEGDPVAAHLSLGDAYMAAGQYQQAVAEYQAGQKRAPSDPRVYRALGNGYYWLGQYEEASRQYQNWVMLAPKDSTAHLLLGMLYQTQKKDAEALGELEQAAALASCSIAEHQVLAGAYLDTGDYARAVVQFAAAVQISPGDADAQYQLGTTLHMQAGPVDPGTDPGEQVRQLWAAAAQALGKAVSLRPDFAEAQFALGTVSMDQQAYDRAAAAYEQAARLRPSEDTYLASLANAYEKLQRWDDAAGAYQKALALNDSPTYHVYLGAVYDRQGKVDAALSEYQKAVAGAPGDPLAARGLADLYQRMGRVGDAIAVLQKAATTSQDPGIQWLLASLYQEAGELHLAVEAYRRTAELDNSNLWARVQLGNLYVQLGRLDEATGQYQAALAVKPDSAEAHYGLAGVLYRRCNLSGAAQEAQAAAAAAPGNSLYRGFLGGLREAQGRGDEAAALFGVLRGAPATDGVAHLMAADYLFRANPAGQGGAEAASQYQQVLEAAGTPPLILSLAHGALGQVRASQGQPVSARAELQAALVAWPANADAQTGLGDIALRAGDPQGALAAYEQAGALMPEYVRVMGPEQNEIITVGVALRRGLALQRLGHGTEGTSELDRALAGAQGLAVPAPQWPRGRFLLGLVYLARGEQAQAEAEFAAAIQCDQSMAAARVRAEAELLKLR